MDSHACLHCLQPHARLQPLHSCVVNHAMHDLQQGLQDWPIFMHHQQPAVCTPAWHSSITTNLTTLFQNLFIVSFMLIKHMHHCWTFSLLQSKCISQLSSCSSSLRLSLLCSYSTFKLSMQSPQKAHAMHSTMLPMSAFPNCRNHNAKTSSTSQMGAVSHWD